MRSCGRCGAPMGSYPDIAFRSGAAGAKKRRRVAHVAGLYEDDDSGFCGLKGAMRFSRVELCAECLEELVAWIYGPEAIDKGDEE